VVVVDSFSKDATCDIARKLGCELLEHPFENYSVQRNWAQQAIGIDSGWYLHLDSDEVLSPELRASIKELLSREVKSFDGYLMRRTPYFMGKRLRFGAISPTWHLRLYRAGKGKCEDRLYDQHFVMDGPTGTLAGDIRDLQIATVEQWTASHNRWSTAEADEVAELLSESATDSGQNLTASLFGDRRMKKRWLKNRVWYRLPILVRPFLFFTYSYFIRLGFLDGKVGLVYCVLQSFWFRFLVDAKILEKATAEQNYRVLFQQLAVDSQSSPEEVKSS
jgi:glycosyltransferase involved in cell wall biosynthesis